MIRQPLFQDNPADVAALLRRLPSAFPNALVELMRWCRCTVEQLAEYALTSSSTVSRLRNDPDYESSLETIVGLCIGLHLPPAIYLEFIRKAGYIFKATKRHIAYQQLLAQAYFFGWDMFQFNEALVEWGVGTIGMEA